MKVASSLVVGPLKLGLWLLGPLCYCTSVYGAFMYDVAVVGGGLSGLMAARELTAAKRSVIVLEARDRVGGRVENFNLDNGGVTELGAAFVGPTQDRVLALAKELGLETFSEYNKGKNVFYYQGEAKTYSSASNAIPPVGKKGLLELIKILEKVNSMAKEIDVHAPWTHSNAQTWDSMTLSSWLDQYLKAADARALLESAIAAVFSAEPSELSFLYTLAYIAAAGNQTKTGDIGRLLYVNRGAQESRIVGGTGLIATRMAHELGSSKILLEAPVHSIIKGNAGYTISAGNNTVMAEHVIVAMSPPLAARIAYRPRLPAARDQLTQRFFMGALGKATAIYKTPFWRKNGLTGQAVSGTGATRATFDVSPPDGSYGALLGFLEADQMRDLDTKTDKEIQDLVQADFVNYFGKEAADVTQWVVKRWDSNIYSRGGPVALAGPGTLTKYGPALRAPFENIHFAGTESSSYWTGYMDGALRSGERAAREIIHA